MVVVLWARPQDPLAFRWDVGVGYCLQHLKPHGLVDSGAGLGLGLAETAVEGSSPVRTGRLWWRFVGYGWWGNRRPNVAAGLNGVVLCGRLRGRGPRSGQGGAGCG